MEERGNFVFRTEDIYFFFYFFYYRFVIELKKLSPPEEFAESDLEKKEISQRHILSIESSFSGFPRR